MGGWSVMVVAWTVGMVGPPPPASRRVGEGDLPPVLLNAVRATVVVQQGNVRGSGTIIASVPGETLILTAWHVAAAGRAPTFIELHRYNLGHERAARSPGGGSWPQRHKVTVVAESKGQDLAIVRVAGLATLPHVARLELDEAEPPAGRPVASIGIDGGVDLLYWESRVRGQALVDLGRGLGKQRFVVTHRPPEPGRSGGGLFRGDGVLVAVAVGQVKNPKDKGEVWGLFAPTRDVRDLLERTGLDLTLARSAREAKRAVASPARARIRAASPGTSARLPL